MSDKKTIHGKLLQIQGELKAPKGQFNNFGKYKYRSCEDILEAAKPLCVKHNCLLNLTDDLVQIGERYYIEAHAIITNVDDGSSVCVKSLAREEESKKGMDGSQVTGASSSYARKYALNGLFCTDDNKDSDTTNEGDNSDGKNKKPAVAEVEKSPEEVKDDSKLIKAIAEIEKITKEIFASAENEEDSKKIKKSVGDAIKMHLVINGKKTANYNAIKDVKTASNVYKEIMKLKGGE